MIPEIGFVGDVEEYDGFKYEIFEHPDDDYPAQKWYAYKIYTSGCWPYDDGVVEDPNGYDSPQECRFAAIGHITELQNPDDREYL